MKTLVSWIAVNNDFHHDLPAENSPNMDLHRHYYADHDRHILLCSLRDDAGSSASGRVRKEHEKALMLRAAIEEGFPGHKVELRFMDVENVIDLEEVFTRVEQLMMTLRGDEIEIFFSPGTSIMQVVWFIFHMDKNYHTTLIQGVKKEFNDGKVPGFFETHVEESLFRRDIVVKNAVLEDREKGWDEPLITPSIKDVYADAEKIGSVDRVPCLITGPSGAGKEVLAKFLFRNSVRAGKVFMTVNSGAVPDTLLHSMLFGHRKGSFTGADKDHKGYFEEADKGTVFLDEIGDIGPEMQLSLLRFLQQGEIQPLGTSVIRKVDVRVIAATNADLKERCRKGKFRWDLYYRLARTRLHLPGLKERSADEVATLTDFFLQRFSAEFKKPLLTLEKAAMARIQEHSWPGNIRELENLIINLYVFCKDKVSAEEVEQALDEPSQAEPFNLNDRVLRHVEGVYRYFNGNKKRASDVLGVSRTTLYKYLEALGISEETA